MALNTFAPAGRSRGWAVPLALSALLTAAPARSADDGDEKNLFMGVVVKVEDGHLVARPAGKDGPPRTIRITKETQFSYVGFKGTGKAADKPGVGFAMRASLAKDDVAKAIVFTPDYPPLKAPENRHKLSPEELFKAADANKDGKVDFVEYATAIFQSPKHLPDRWRKRLDQNGNDVLDLKEFAESLELLSWWRLSRKTADEWVKEFDKNASAQLEKEEVRALIGSAHGKLDQVFAKLDKDKSNGLSAKELQAHLDDAIAGKN